jgi:hypothetical protein
MISGVAGERMTAVIATAILPPARPQSHANEHERDAEHVLTGNAPTVPAITVRIVMSVSRPMPTGGPP